MLLCNRVQKQQQQKCTHSVSDVPLDRRRTHTLAASSTQCGSHFHFQRNKFAEETNFTISMDRRRVFGHVATDLCVCFRLIRVSVSDECNK